MFGASTFNKKFKLDKMKEEAQLARAAVPPVSYSSADSLMSDCCWRLCNAVAAYAFSHRLSHSCQSQNHLDQPYHNSFPCLCRFREPTHLCGDWFSWECKSSDLRRNLGSHRNLNTKTIINFIINWNVWITFFIA